MILSRSIIIHEIMKVVSYFAFLQSGADTGGGEAVGLLPPPPELSRGGGGIPLVIFPLLEMNLGPP